MNVTRSVKTILKVANAVLNARLNCRALPYRIIMNITHQCNSKCHTCGIWKIYNNKPELLREELKTEEFKAFFKSIPNLIWFSFGGGEPFLRKDLVEILVGAYENLKKLTIVDMSTNGLLPQIIENKILEILESTKIPLFSIGVSIDGPPLLNDHIRGVNDAWKKALETYKRLKELSLQHENFNVHINYTLSGLNQGRLGELLGALEANGLFLNPSEISISIASIGIAFGIQNSKEKEDNYIIITNYDAAIQDVNTLLKRWKLNISDARNVGKQIFLKLARDKYFRNPRRMVIPCAALQASCFIDPYGNIYPCTIWPVNIGNLRKNTYNLQKVWFSVKRKQIRSKILNGNCPNCWSGCESSTSILQHIVELSFTL
jgi:MoaA/NifB/PqqE/SkfB family radical SAM enzyme